MNDLLTNQKSIENKDKPGSIELMVSKYKRAINVIKIIMFCVVMLLLVSFHLALEVDRYTYKSVPVNYERLNTNSFAGQRCYIDSIISCEEMFCVLTTNTYNDIKVGSDTSIYYLAEDKNGFKFSIVSDFETQRYLKNYMESGMQEMKLYGTVTTLPKDIEYFPSDAAEGVPQYAIDEISEENKK
ncbi:MAG: hypothetical protein Q4G23_12360, partial [Clostridia bacterium]|nr:hypothetical protein [Clostridia bacterium]